MESRTTKSKVTVQGVGSPVPASVVGAQAGPQTSSANDCNVVEVVNLASTAQQATRNSAHDEDVASLRALIVESDKKVESRLSEMRSLIKVMLDALKKQPNVNKVIKDGLPTLIEQLDDLEECRNPLKKAHGILEKVSTPRAARRRALRTGTAPSPVLQPHSTKGGQKRIASSPPIPLGQETQKKKKKDAVPSTEWTEVVKKKEKKNKKREEGKKGAIRKYEQPAPHASKSTATSAKSRMSDSAARRKPPSRPDAIVLRPAEGKTFADVLSCVRKEVKPEAHGVDVCAIRRTRGGDVLLELKRASPDARAAFSEALRVAAGDGSSVKELVPRASLEIRDLDSCSSKEEVEEAVRKSLGEYKGLLRVGLTRPNAQEQVTAIVTIDEGGAKALLQSSRVKIGWVNCRVRRRVEVPRCFKCLGYGHQSQQCTGPDRSKVCYRCGAEKHKAVDCTASPRCFLCAEVEGKPEARHHVAGSGPCRTFREALALAKR